MPDKRIRIELTGSREDEGLVRLSDLATELNCLRDVLRRLDHLVSRSEAATTYFRITDLHYSSPALLELESVPIKPRIDCSAVVVDRFLDGLQAIKKGSAPSDFDRDLIESYGALAGPLKRNVSEKAYMSGDVRVELREDLDAPIRSILGKDEFTQGFVSGILELINIHAGANKFRIYPIAGPKQIDCHFAFPLLSKAIEGINGYVSVSGRVKYKSKERFPYAIEVEDIEVYPEEDELPTIFDIRGIAPEATGSLSSEDFVRRIRDVE